MRQIGREASCDRRTVLRRLPVLVDAGYLRTLQGDPGRALLYQLLLPGCDPQALPPKNRATAGKPPKVRPSVTRGYDHVVTTNNPHSTITSSLPPSAPQLRGREAIKDGKEAKGDHPSVVQARIAERLGRGDKALGWLLLGEIAENELDQIIAQQRSGRLTDQVIEVIRSKLRRLIDA
jgi:hypothetical protein